MSCDLMGWLELIKKKEKNKDLLMVNFFQDANLFVIVYGLLSFKGEMVEIKVKVKVKQKKGKNKKDKNYVRFWFRLDCEFIQLFAFLSLWVC